MYHNVNFSSTTYLIDTSVTYPGGFEEQDAAKKELQAVQYQFVVFSALPTHLLQAHLFSNAGDGSRTGQAPRSSSSGLMHTDAKDQRSQRTSLG
jgi:hypothetical protein